MVALTVAATLASAESAAGQAVVPEAKRRAELIRLVRHDCGSCHGLTLAGGLGPPLTSAALAARTPDDLKLVILYGRAGTAMPGWAPLLSEADAQWIAERLLRGFPDAD
jgi:cytochrome c55X